MLSSQLTNRFENRPLWMFAVEATNHRLKFQGDSATLATFGARIAFQGYHEFGLQPNKSWIYSMREVRIEVELQLYHSGGSG